MQSKDIFEKIDNTTYIDRDAEHEMKESFMAYAMAVNVSRAIPDVRDGLKPVHRRILYSMNEIGLTADKPFRKCAKIVGDVLGSYHPHGDTSVYDALVRLAQDFTINEPLVDGHGNFGSVDGDDAAAYRYTEARLSKIASELLRDIGKDTVDFTPNFDATKVEPRVLPSRFPNLLVNGSDGIAVGMATSIPPHNLGEVIDAVLAMIDNPSVTVDELMQYIPAPDFPTGGEILANNAIREAYTTGHGAVVMRAITEFESFDEGRRWRIIIKAIPYQVNKARLVKQIADLIKNKKIEGITYVGDQSSGREGMRVVVELKREANPQVVLNQLFKSTQLQLSMGITFLALVNNEPKILNLQEMIFHYLQFQREVVTRRTRYDLNKAEERAHILEGLVIAVNNIDEVIKIIKQSQDKNVALKNLQDKFDLSERQANAILEMKLSRLTGLEVEKLKEELAELELDIEYYKDVLADPKKIDDIIAKELTEIKDKYANERKSQIVRDYDDIDIEDLIERHDVVVSLTNQGYIKSQAVTEYKSQHRGGRGVNSKMKEEDFVTDVFAVNSHDRLMMFSDKGKVYMLKTYMIPEVARQNKGRALVNLLPLESDEKINTILKYETGEDKYLVLATKSGLIKRTRISEFDNVRKNGKIAIKLAEDDCLVGARIVDEDSELLMAADNGKCLRFRAKDIRLVGRNSQGVKSMKIDDGESIVGMIIANSDSDILTVTELGYAKRSRLDDYRVQGRRGKGIKAGVFNDKTGKVVAIKNVTADNDVLAISSDGVMIRTHADTINLVSRTSLGVKLMRVGVGDAVVSVAVVDREADEETEAETTNEENN